MYSKKGRRNLQDTIYCMYKRLERMGWRSARKKERYEKADKESAELHFADFCSQQFPAFGSPSVG